MKIGAKLLDAIGNIPLIGLGVFKSDNLARQPYARRCKWWSAARSPRAAADASFLLLTASVVLFSLSCTQARSPHILHDKSLASLPLYFYPSADTAHAPRATVFFFGNDVGFWKPHQTLAEKLSGEDFTVVGFDVTKYLKRLPTNLTLRDSVFAKDIPIIIVRSIHEMNAEKSPVILGGHSFGADVALWTAGATRIPGVVGVLALGPTERSHLTVTALDLANLSNPREPGSFSAQDAIRRIPSGLGIALLRGSHDRRRGIDSSLVAAGGGRVDYRVIPLAGHSLKSLIIAGPMIESALDRLLAKTDNPR